MSSGYRNLKGIAWAKALLMRITAAGAISRIWPKFEISAFIEGNRAFEIASSLELIVTGA